MHLVGWAQLWASKCLRTRLRGAGVGFVVLANFCGVNTTTTAQVKLPAWFHWTCSWEETHAIRSFKPEKASSVPIPRRSWQIIGYWVAFFLKGSQCNQPSTELLSFEWNRQVESQNWVIPGNREGFMLWWEQRQKQGGRRREGEGRLIFREEILEQRCLKGIAGDLLPNWSTRPASQS